MNGSLKRVALGGALVAAATTLPGLGNGTLWDNSETAYGEVAREILLTHDWIVLHQNGAAWFVQPPLYFWIAAILAQLFGVTEFALRLPSALATIALGVAVAIVTARAASARAALFSTVVLSTALMQAVLGRLAIMDALLDLAVGAALLCWFEAARTGSRSAWYAGVAALALGTLAKGPVAPVVALLVAVPWALWERRAGGAVHVPSLRRAVLGLAVYLGIVGPWALALGRAAGPGAFGELVGHYTVGRYLGTIENQNGPLYYYVPVVVLGFFPWFPYLVPAVAAAWRTARARASSTPRGAFVRLALVWAVVPFVFFSLASTKLPNYVALELPALAILVGLWFDEVTQRDDRRAALWCTAVVPVLVGVLGVAAGVFARTNRLTADVTQLVPFALALGGATILGAAACFVLLASKRRAWLGPFAFGAANVAVLLIIALWALPSVERFKPMPRFAALIDRDARAGDLVAVQSVSGGNALAFYTHPGIAILVGPNQIPPLPQNDPERRICAVPRAFVVTTKRRPRHDPTYGRTRTILAQSDRTVLFLYAGPACAADEKGMKAGLGGA